MPVDALIDQAPVCTGSTSCPAEEHTANCVYTQVADWEGAIDAAGHRLPTTPGKPRPLSETTVREATSDA
jgi:hypothetical protein